MDEMLDTVVIGGGAMDRPQPGRWPAADGR